VSLLRLSDDGRTLHLPALATAHSHAFQLAMRGTAQRRRPLAATDASDDFWSWRGQMYKAATALTPESMYAVGKAAFAELRRAGVRTVGEFHYIQHQADGTPYDDRTVMSEVLIQAARENGLRIALLRVAYHRAGPGLPAEPGQRRFCDPDVDHVLGDLDHLRKKYAGQSDVTFGLAPHSVRAVPPSWLEPLAAYARRHDLPLHMHVAEQVREVEECVAETGKRPLALCADLGLLSPRFVAVHATQLEASEARQLGEARAFACICPTTERDLGDGLPDLGALRAAGARLCTGIDSHVLTDPIDDLRGLETHERLRTRKRVTFAPAAPNETPAEELWRSGSIEGAVACGFADAGGEIRIRRDHPILAFVEDDAALLDAVVFSGQSSMIEP
jgi:formiminoglutamate deiminase